MIVFGRLGDEIIKQRGIVIPILMAFQVILFAIGVYQLCEGKMFFGLFNIILNAIFFAVNVNTLRTMRCG